MTSSGAGWPVHSVNAAAPWWSSISSPSAVVAAGRRGVAQQPGPGVDEVEDEQVAVEDLGRDRASRPLVSPIEVALTRTLVLASSASMIDSCQGIARSSMCAALRAEVLDQALGPVEVAVEHDDPLEALA